MKTKTQFKKGEVYYIAREEDGGEIYTSDNPLIIEDKQMYKDSFEDSLSYQYVQQYKKAKLLKEYPHFYLFEVLCEYSENNYKTCVNK